MSKKWSDKVMDWIIDLKPDNQFPNLGEHLEEVNYPEIPQKHE